MKNSYIKIVLICALLIFCVIIPFSILLGSIMEQQFSLTDVATSYALIAVCYLFSVSVAALLLKIVGVDLK